jgi:hypothetical protein
VGVSEEVIAKLGGNPSVTEFRYRYSPWSVRQSASESGVDLSLAGLVQGPNT